MTRGHELEDEQYIEVLHSIMHELASRGNVVIVGRAGNMILRDVPGVLRVNCVADFDDRVDRITERDSVGREEAERIIRDRDDARAYLFKRFFGVDHPDSPELYHFTVNSSVMDLEYCADLVVGAATALEEGRLSSAAVVEDR